MALTLSQDDFLALGRQLADAAVAAYTQALAAHALTVNVPAPTAHPLIETIVNQYGGGYTVAPPPTPNAGVDPALALQAALLAKGVITTADVTAAAATLAVQTAQPAQVATATPAA